MQLKSFLKHGSLAWLLALGVAVCAIVGFANQPPQRLWTHSWSARHDLLNSPVAVQDSPVHTLDFTSECPPSTTPNSTLLDLSAAPAKFEYLSIVVQDANVAVRLDGEDVVSIAIPARQCNMRMHYDGEHDRVNFTVGSVTQSAKIDRGGTLYPAPRISGIHAAPLLQNLDAKLDFTIWTAQTSPMAAQVITFSTAMGLLALLLLIVFISGRSSVRGVNKQEWTLHAANRSTVAVLAAAVVGMFLAPPIIDDAWLMTMARQYDSLGYVTNYFHHASPAMPQGHWLTSLSRLWLSLPNNVLVMRIVPAACAVAGWMILKRWVLRPVAEAYGSNLPIYLAATVFVPWTAVPMMTLRYEPIIVLMWTVAAALLVKVQRTGSLFAFGVILVLSAMAITAHQTGWTVAALAIVAFATLIVRHRDSMVVRWHQVGALILATMAAAASMLLLDNRSSDLLRSVRVFADSRTFRKSLLSIDHWIDGITTAPNIRAFAIITFVGLFAIGLRHTSSEPRIVSTLRTAAVATLAITTINASKWVWHLTALAPLAAVLAALVAIQFDSDRDHVHRQAHVRVMALAVPVLAGIAITRATRFPIDASTGWLLVPLALIAALPTLATGLRARSKNQHRFDNRMVLTMAVLPTLVVLGTAWFPRFTDATDNMWTLARQNWQSITNTGECGVLEHFDVVTPGAPLAYEPTSVFNGRFEMPQFNGVDIRPFEDIQIFTTVDPLDLSFAGTVDSPWQVIDGSDPVAFWALNKYDYAARIIVQAKNRGGKISTLEASPSATVSDEFHRRNFKIDPTTDSAPYWMLNIIEVPDDAVQVRLRLVDQSTTKDNWLAVTEFVHPTKSTLRDLYDANEEATYVEPEAGMYAPCVTEPQLRRGMMEPVGLSLGQPYWSFAYLSYEHAWVEVGCKEFEELGDVCAYLIQ